MARTGLSLRGALRKVAAQVFTPRVRRWMGYGAVAAVTGLVWLGADERARKRLGAWMLGRFATRVNEDMGPRKRRLFSGVRGSVLEIGAGTGANFAFFPRDRELRYLGVEPQEEALAALRLSAVDSGFPEGMIETRCATAESVLPQLPSDSFDSVVCTLSLCSVDDPLLVTREIHRVLRPGGKLFFLEHVGHEAGSFSRKVQEQWSRVTWPVMHCRADREQLRLLQTAGFSMIVYEWWPWKERRDPPEDRVARPVAPYRPEYQEKPFAPLYPLIAGVATKTAPVQQSAPQSSLFPRPLQPELPPGFAPTFSWGVPRSSL
jgi:SAM-dependent methyltransferase